MPSRIVTAAAVAALSLLALGARPMPSAPGARRVAPPDVPRAEYAARRARLAERMAEGSVLLAQGMPEPAQDYDRFVQGSPFLYLTGYREAGAALVMAKAGGRATAWLFVQPKNPAQEVWSGRRLGVAGATALTGIDARETATMPAVLDSLLRLPAMPRLAVVVSQSEGGHVAEHDRAAIAALRERHPRVQVSDLSSAVAALRARKSDAEMALIRRAAEITVVAQREAARMIEPGMNEFEAQALVEYTFRRNGADRPGFASIVGSGPNATTLHYNANDRFMEAGDLLVMDVGASYRGYSADVTRTIPVSGTFTPDQRAVYRIVRDAQAAAERQARPGAPAARMSDSATAIIAAGLARLGLVESADATYDCDARSGRACPQVSLYYMHGLGHGIGLDVHDPEQSDESGRLAEGSAYTIEPGIYVRANLLEILPDTPRNRQLAARIGAAVSRFANVGVRIEDDYLVTARGVEWISRAPREASDVEAAMWGPFAPAKRDAAMVDAYRRVTQ